MSDYRDDRPALRQRIEALEAELQRSQDRAAELEERLRTPVETKPKLEAAHKPALPAVLIVCFVGIVMLVSGLFSRSKNPATPPPVAPPPLPSLPMPTLPSQPAPRDRSASCECTAKNGDVVTLAYRSTGTMSFGGNTTHVLDVGFRISNLGGVSEIDLATGLETVPPSKLEGGKQRLLLACVDDRMVLALGHRVSAWSLDDGQALWSATLPAPVGKAENGPLDFGCERLPVKDGVISVPQPTGATLIAADDGSLQNQR